MKIILHFTIAFFLLAAGYSNAAAQLPNWSWARQSNGTGTESGECVATDLQGNVVTAGEFGMPAAAFGTSVFTNAGIPNTNSRDVFIVKYDSTGSQLWARAAGGSGEDYAKAICTDANGNIFVTGFFASDSITFGTFTLHNDTVWSMFVVKYDASGNPLWAKTAHAMWTNDGSAITTDATGNVLLTGNFYAPGLVFGTDTIVSEGSQDFFVMKLDPSGNLLWMQPGGGSNYDNSTAIATDGAGNILVTGAFRSPAVYLGNDVLINAWQGNADLFVVKYDASGNVLWATSAGGWDMVSANAVCADAAGNVIITGNFESNFIRFGTDTLYSYNYNSSSPPTDLFIVKFDANGNVLWAKRAGYTSDENGTGVACDAGGNIYATGVFYSDSISFGTVTAHSGGQSDAFVVKLNPQGNTIWNIAAGGTGLESGSALATDAWGHVLLTGMFDSSPLTFGSTVLNNTGMLDYFVARLKDNSSTGVTHIAEPGFEIRCAPNPFAGETVLYSGQVLQNASVALISSTGQTVKYITGISGNRVPISCRGLAPGLYTVVLTAGNSTVRGRVVLTIN